MEMCSRKQLVRSVSTCSEDLILNIDDALNELSHLSQRQALRQQWARKNLKSTKWRPSGSVCSVSSSTSCCSSNSCSNSCSHSSSSCSMSSMSSSFTQSSQSSCESWDSFSESTDISMSSISSSIDYPRVARRLSKPKLNMFRPYCKPRRFSLQLVSHPESPETMDDLLHNSANSWSSGKQTSSSTIGGLGRSQTPPKYSRLVSEKENFSSGIKVKSNPSSPSKSEPNSVLIDANLMQFNAIHERFVSGNTSNTSTSITCSSLLPPQQLTTTGVLLLRSKSLDDLSSCFGANYNNFHFNTNYQLSCSSTLSPKQSQPMAAAQTGCDIDNVLQRISTLQV